jgi:hypothetical protein
MLVFWSSMIVYAAVVLPRMIAPESTLYSSFLTIALVNFIGSLIRTGALILAWWFVRLSARQFEPDNPVRPAWLLLKWGLFIFVLAQLTLAVITWSYEKTPYPSPADALFIIAMAMIPIALLAFVRGYLGGGMLVEGRAGLMTIGLVAAVVFLVLGFLFLRPVVAAGRSWLETTVNVAYPALDAIMIVVAIVLLKLTMSFRGGRMWEVWMVLLAGFFCMGVGDILFAYFSTLEMAHLDPLLDVMFTWSYLLLALGAILNRKLTADAGDSSSDS